MAICGDIMHSRVARSNIHLLNIMGARVRVVAPRTLMPTDIDRMGVEVFHDMKRGLQGVRHRHDAAPADGAHAGHLHPLDPRILPLLRPRPTRSWQAPSAEALIMHPGR